MAIAFASSWIAQFTTSSTDRSWPRWMTSAPLACRIRRMTLIAASCPSNSAAAVTIRILFRPAYGSAPRGSEAAAIGLP